MSDVTVNPLKKTARSAMGLLGLVALAAACAPFDTTEAESVRDLAQSQFAEHEETADAERSRESTAIKKVVHNPGRYVGRATPSGPTWMTKWVTMRVRRLPAESFLRRVCITADVQCAYDFVSESERTDGSSVGSPNKLIDFDFGRGGSVDQLFANAEELTGLQFRIVDNRVIWARRFTEAIDVSFLPGDAAYLVGQTRGGGGGAGGGSTLEGASISATNDQQFLSFEQQAGRGAWQELETALTTLLAEEEDLDVHVDRANAQLIANGTRTGLAQVKSLVRSLNERYSRQIIIDVVLFSIRLRNERDFGINWSTVVADITGGIGAGTDLTFNSGLLPGLEGSDATNTNLAFTRFNGDEIPASELILRGLSRLGDLKVVTRPRAVTLNGQLAQVNNITQVSYLARTVPYQGNANDTGTGQAGLEPGIIEIGFTLYVLPKLVDDGRIMLMVSAKIADLISLRRDQDDTTQIDTPQLSEVRFLQRAIVESGGTLLLAGIQQTRDDNNQANAVIANQQSGNSRREEALLLITPTVDVRAFRG